ncbi:MAG: AraC family transcriptional regulator [Ferruginibacter sp.]
MKLYIKNMVCARCKTAVQGAFDKNNIPLGSLELGEAETEDPVSKNTLGLLRHDLALLGFELLDDKKTRIIEKIKNAIVTLVHHSEETLQTNLSAYISSRIHMDYHYLSNLFSETEGITIEKYFIAHKIEKVKELLVYDELTLSEIADRMGYSSVAYLSNQFKKITGLTPSYFKSLKEHKRKSIEEL